MRFGILGPLEILADEGPILLRQPRHRALLAYLLLHRGRVITTDELVGAVWGPQAPATARSQIHAGMSALRRHLRAAGADGTVATRPGGYQLSAEKLDADVFERFLRLAHAADDPAEAARLVRDGLDLWRAEPLADVAAAYAADARRRLQDRRLDALELLADAELRRGRPEQVRALLAEAVDRHPERQRMAAQLSLAVQRCGPGSGPDRPLPRQLPARIPAFCGREAQLAALDGLLAAGDGAIAVVAGTAGVGKTALAVHWARRVADRFPDGQLYLNLRGYDPANAPMPPGEAVHSLLDALAVPRLPEGLNAQAGMLRSLLAQRRVLILLDNARDAEQVQPLLIGSPGCLTLVTSRDQLTGLVVANGASPVNLDLPSGPDAHAMLTARLGAARVGAEPDAAEEIISRCARLPLALATVAAHAAARPDFSLRALADDLRQAQWGLDAYRGTDLRAVFSWSYRTLRPAAATLFRLIGLHPGPDLGIAAAASLAGLPVRETRTLLLELSQANLVTEPAPGRFGMHDLLRDFARELASARPCDGADLRMVQHYLHTAYRADRLLQPFRQPIAVGAPDPRVAIDGPADVASALAWFTAERGVLVACVGWAAEHGLPAQARQLAWTLETFFDLRGRWQDWAATQQIAVAAARSLGDRDAEAHGHCSRGMALNKMHRYSEAYEHLREALRLATDGGDKARQAWCHRGLANVYENQGLYRQSLEHVLAALPLSQELGDTMTEARTRNMVGWLHARLGEHGPALAYSQRAFEQLSGLGNRHALAHVHHSLGYIHHHRRDLDQAATHYRQAALLFQEIGNRYEEAEVLLHQGDARYVGGDHAGAAGSWRRALAILDDLGHPAARDAARRLNGNAPVADLPGGLAGRLDGFMHRAGIGAKTLSKLTGVPRTAIDNWRDGTVRRPRDWRPLVRIARVLSLTRGEADALLTAARHADLAELHRDLPAGHPDRASIGWWLASA
ncbi:BTAD domain-containing putative transcriptional regulator [Catellatospora sp. NPDC049609]|uniref:BTAD domain-containing putative transcriptional regulator n=1 Tax=Catellatospora sp. NPDC049609 TaxID=3155505 RepID=UPI0034249A05